MTWRLVAFAKPMTSSKIRDFPRERQKQTDSMGRLESKSAPKLGHGGNIGIHSSKKEWSTVETFSLDLRLKPVRIQAFYLLGLCGGTYSLSGSMVCVCVWCVCPRWPRQQMKKTCATQTRTIFLTTLSRTLNSAMGGGHAVAPCQRVVRVYVSVIYVT